MGDRFRFGHVVALSFSTWVRALPLLLPLALVVHVPRVAYGEYLSSRLPFRPDFLSFVASDLMRSFSEDVFAVITQAPLVVAVWAILRRERAAYFACLRAALRALARVLGVALKLAAVQSIVYLAAILGSVAVLRPEDTTVMWLIIGAWQVVRCVVLSPLWVAVPASVLDARPLGRSWGLTRGRRASVFAILLLLGTLDWVGIWLLAMPPDASSRAYAIAEWTRSLLSVSLSAVFVTVTYHALRLEKEGPESSELGQVFA